MNSKESGRLRGGSIAEWNSARSCLWAVSKAPKVLYGAASNLLMKLKVIVSKATQIE